MTDGFNYRKEDELSTGIESADRCNFTDLGIDRRYCIDPRTGWITGWIDLRYLLPKEDKTKSVDVLNGIAYDAGKDRLFVIGKYWPKLLKIRLK